MTTLLLFAASLRENSFNKKLISSANKILNEQQIQTDLVDFDEFSAPLYDGDIEEKVGIPREAISFVEHLKKSDGLIISSPEYNFSTPGTLKNLIDWVSRIKPMPFKGTKILLLSASSALAGGSRGLLQTRIPLICCGAYVFPQMFSLSNANEAFDEKSDLKERKLKENLTKTINHFLTFVK